MDDLVQIGPPRPLSHGQANGLSHVPVARLGALLGAGSYDDLMAATGIRLVQLVRDAQSVEHELWYG